MCNNLSWYSYDNNVMLHTSKSIGVLLPEELLMSEPYWLGK